MKPRILLATTCRWPQSAARLAMAFADVGSEVDIVCPQRHPAAKTRAVRRIHPFQRQTPLPSLRMAIRESEPDLIVPCDEPATLALHWLHSRLKLREASATRLLDVLERSLGPVASQAIMDGRSRLIDLAHSADIRVPETLAIATKDQLSAWLSQHGLPDVLKADGTAGGEGVRILHTATAVEQAFERMRTRPAVAPAGQPLPGARLPRRQPGVTVQRFIEGRDATNSVACWHGQVVASISCEVLQTMYAHGPASVLRLIEHPEMDHCAAQLIKRLGLSGIYGFDFRLEAHTGEAYLIEMNARATQISHLALGVGGNLPAALHAMLSDKPIPPTKHVTDKEIIVLFPQEWSRDPLSAFLSSGFHDVPWREPGLVKHCIDHYLPGSKSRLGARSQHLLHMLYNKTRQR